VVVVGEIELSCGDVFCVGGVGLPVGLGGGEVEGLLVGVGAEGVELGVGGSFGEEGGELGAGFGGWARVEGA